MKSLFIVLIFYALILPQGLYAQCEFEPDTTLTACHKGQFLCGVMLHGWMGTLPDTLSEDAPEPLCQTGTDNADNIQWYRFYVCEEYIELKITPSACTEVMNAAGDLVSGMQAGIYKSCDYIEQLACTSDGNTTEFILSGSGFESGELVYMFLDGTAGSVCDYQIEVIEGIDTMLIEFMSDPGDLPQDGGVLGPECVCTGSSGEYNFTSPTCVGEGLASGCAYNGLFDQGLVCYEWIIDPPTGYVFIGDSTAAEVTIEWTSEGNYTVDVNVHIDPVLANQNPGGCSSGIFDCGNFIPRDVKVVGPEYEYLPPITICEGESVDFCGAVYSESVIVECQIDSCKYEVQEIILKPLNFEFISGQICSGDCFEFLGQSYCAPGVHYYMDPSNCGTEYEIEVFEFYIDADIIVDRDINCANSIANISVVNLVGSGGFDFEWIDPFGNPINGFENISVSEGGNYTCFITDQNGCFESLSAFVVEDRVPVSVDLIYNDIDCIKPESFLSYNTSDNIEYAQWIGPNGFNATGQNANATEGGDYQLIVIGANQCETVYDFTIDKNLVDVQIEFDQDNYLWFCNSKEVLVYPGLSVEGLQLEWSTNDGQIQSGINDQDLTAASPGTYTLFAIDPISGCNDQQSIVVEEDPSMLVDFEINYTDYLCLGSNDGMIEIAEIVGGAPPFTLTINDQLVGDVVIRNLQAGSYNLKLSDANACEIRKEIVIEESPDIAIDMEKELTIDYAKDEWLSANINVDAAMIDIIIWTDDQGNEMGTGPQIVINVTEDQLVTVTIYDIHGCSTSETVQLRVKLLDGVYAPNVFSPNKDGFNDFFTLYSGESPGVIKSFEIYDRWGTLVFSNNDMDFSIPEDGWDGTLHDKEAAAGLYVFKANIDIGNGEEKFLDGAVSLLR